MNRYVGIAVLTLVSVGMVCCGGNKDGGSATGTEGGSTTASGTTSGGTQPATGGSESFLAGGLSTPYAFTLYSKATGQTAPYVLRTLILSSDGNACEAMQNGNFVKNSNQVTISLGVIGTDGYLTLPTAAGTYTLPAASDGNQPAVQAPATEAAAVAYMLPDVANCLEQARSDAATGGSVQVTQLGDQSTTTEATYTLTFGVNDTLQGKVSAKPCMVPTLDFLLNPSLTCQ